MKKIVCLVAATFAMCYSFAQNTLELIDTGNITRERWRDSMLRMDMNQVPTGFLLEYSMAGFESSQYDGINNDDEIIKDDGKIFELHSILWYSKVNGNAAIDVTDNLYGKASSDNGTSNVIPLVFIYQHYNRIRESALSEGLFTIDADSVGILDVPGRAASPYDTYEVFAFAPFKTAIMQFNAIQFTLPDELFYMEGLTGVEVDFDDGAGFRTLSKGGGVSIYYATEGLKYLTARINTGSGIRIAKCVIDYKRPATYSQPDYTQSFEVEPVYTDENQYLGGNGMTAGSSIKRQVLSFSNPGANVRVENGCDRVFDKPIIIVEGFDPTGSLTIEALKDRFSQASFIETMQGYGYDFVYVDFTNNTDFIENNAKVLEAVINWVNQTKTGTFKSTVIGFSMGGLVAQWCLKDMEDRGLQHNVENYFSYDAPHQGANVPLGMQYVFKEMIRDMPYLRWSSNTRKLDDGFKSAAARQMLVTYADYSNGPFNWFPNLNTLTPLRAAFAQRLQAKGYPQQTRNFGLAFGRGNNTVNTKDAGNGLQFITANPFSPQTDIFAGAIGLLLVNAEAQASAVPENNDKGTIAYYSFFGIAVRKIFGLRVWPVLALRVRRFDYTGQYPYDDAPGSFEQTQTDFVQNWIGGAAGHATTYQHYGHNFEATVSGLDLQNQNYSAATNWQSSNMLFNVDNLIQNPGQVNGNTLSDPALSPFSAVITGTSDCGSITGGCSLGAYKNENKEDVLSPNSNQWNYYHNGAITSQFAQFIERNILNAPAVPCAGSNGLCNINPSLSGPDVICATGQYQLTGSPSGVTIVWEIQNGNLAITSGQGTPNINVAKLNDGAEVVKVTITAACGGSLVLTKQIRVGASQFNLQIYGPTSVSCGDIARYFTTEYPGASYEWTSPGGWYYLSGQYTPSIGFQLPSYTYSSTSGYVGLTVYDACGFSSSTSIYVNSSCGGYYYYSISPNPASSTFTVAIKETTPDGKKINKSITAINLYDQLGNLKKHEKFNKAKTATLNVSGLSKGTYFVEIVDGTDKERQKLLIQQ